MIFIGNFSFPFLNPYLYNIGINALLQNDVYKTYNPEVLATTTLLLCSCGLGASFLLSKQSLFYANLAQEILQSFLNFPLDIVARACFAVEILMQSCLNLKLNSHSHFPYEIGMYRKYGERVLNMCSIHDIREETFLLLDHLKLWEVEFITLLPTK